MKKRAKITHFNKVISAFFLFACSLHAETGTVRERAELHFGLVKWTDAGDIPLAVPLEASVIPGGSETFPALGADNAAGVPSLYPSLPETGLLDYTGIDQGLLDMLAKVSGGLRDKSIDAALCFPERPFIPVIAKYQLDKLPLADRIFFSRPVADERGLYSSIFRMQFTDGSRRQFVLAHVTAAALKGNWYVTELYFDGKTYAAIARQD